MIRRDEVIQMLDLEDKTDVYVFQMGKVGSTSIVRSIQQQFGDSFNAYQPHFLALNTFHELIDHFSNPYLNPVTGFHTIGQMSVNILLYNKLLKYQNGLAGEKRLKVITLTRDPISWYLSSLIQDFKEYLPDFQKAEKILPFESVAQSDQIAMVRSFLSKLFAFFPKFIENIDLEAAGKLIEKVKLELDYQLYEVLVKHSLLILRPLIWFPQHFEPVLDFDFNEVSFDKSRGYGIYNRSFYDLLIIRFEDLEKSGERTIGDHLKVGSFELKRANVSAKKVGNDIVKTAFSRAENKEVFLSRIYNSDYASKFYSQEKLDSFLEKHLLDN